MGKSLNIPPRMGLKCDSIKGLEGVGRGLERDIGEGGNSVVGVGKEESQPISKFADDSFS